VRRAALLAVVAFVLSSGAALAAEPKTTLPDVEDEVMCVTCNVPLNIAESPQAYQQRELIRRLVEQGLTKEQIKARLVDEYGEDVLALPRDDGVGIAVYVIPVLLVLGMIAAASLLLPRWRRRSKATAPAGTGGPQATDDELRRLDDDLARFD
jgi:cytochrome c-type biogenesis protein CcmH/NrfF